MGSRPRFWMFTAGFLLFALSMGGSHPVSGYSTTSPDFYITTEAPTANVYQGMTPIAAMVVYVYSNSYFSGWVNLTTSVSPNVVNGPAVGIPSPDIYMIPAVTRTPGVLVETQMSTPLLTYNVTVTARSVNLTRTASFNLTVIPPLLPPDFTVAISPFSNALQPGYAESVTFDLNRISPNYFTDVSFNLGIVSSPPGGLEVSGFPSQAQLSYQSTSTSFSFIVASSASAPPGTYTLNVTATEPGVSQSMTGWKPPVTHSGTANIPVGGPPNCCDTHLAPLVYDLQFAGSRLPGQTIQLISSFTNHSNYPATITGLSINTDLANQNVTGAAGLPVTVAAGASVSFEVSMRIPSSAILGPHTMSVVVQWTSTDPYFNTGGWWAQSPITYQKNLMVGPNTTSQGPVSQFLQLLNLPTIYYIAIIGGAALAVAVTLTLLMRERRPRQAKQPQAKQGDTYAPSQKIS
jgi:hypothetical protein